MEKFLTSVGTVTVAVIVVAALNIFWAFPLMWTWNYAITSTFGLPAITWGKSWCIMFVFSSLVKAQPASK